MSHIEFLSDEEYAALGFRSGLEIHQQLDTKRKLFCNCPVGLTDSEPDMQILRHMRPTLSELGEYDGTALMEFRTRKEVIYQLFSDCTCTYEMDDTPPFPLNRDAVEIAIEIALLLNCRIVDEIHVTRKQYLDGSIPTGFQRTAVIGVEGWVPFHGRRVRISMLTLEEDACREVSDIGHTITFKTDRLSTPLVEVITYPDLRTPEEVAAVNRLLGEVMRATGRVRRGIGTVRQDVNVSIEGGTRVEIKGVPKIGYHRALTHVEAMRQKALLEIAAECRKRGLTRENLNPRHVDVTEILATTGNVAVRAALDNGGAAAAVVLPGCAGLFGREVQPGRTFADEVSGKIRVVACIDSKPNLLHMDHVGGGSLNSKEWRAVREAAGAAEGDLVALVFGPSRDVQTAAEEVEGRVLQATEGVPNETRQALGGGVTDFERVLPGPDRMYPDTDTPPTLVTPELVERIREHLPERPWEREERYLGLGLASQMAASLIKSGLGGLFDELMERVQLQPRKLAHALINACGHLRDANGGCKRIDGARWNEAFALVKEGRICIEALPDLLRAGADSTVPLAEIADEAGLTLYREDEIDKACDAALQGWSPYPGLAPKGALRFAAGLVVYKHGRRWPGVDLVARLERKLKSMGVGNAD